MLGPQSHLPAHHVSCRSATANGYCAPGTTRRNRLYRGMPFVGRGVRGTAHGSPTRTIIAADGDPNKAQSSAMPMAMPMAMPIAAITGTSSMHTRLGSVSSFVVLAEQQIN